MNEKEKKERKKDSPGIKIEMMTAVLRFSFT